MKESIPKKEINSSEREPNIEIERKYLLDSEGDMKKLEEKIFSLFPNTKLVGECDEVSNYFSPISKDQALKFAKTLTFNWMYGIDHFVHQLKAIPDDMAIQLRSRTRVHRDKQSFSAEFTFKAGENPLHGEERIEVDAVGESDASPRNLRGLSQLGIKLTSSWHSKRKIYQIDSGTKIDLQHVTGYGYTAEIESGSLEEVQATENQLGLAPANPNVLNAMYRKYSRSWQEYYTGEGKSFSEKDWEEIEAAAKEPVVRNKIK